MPDPLQSRAVTDAAVAKRARATSQRRFWLWIVLALVAYFVLMIGFERSLFAPRPGRVSEDADGFEQTILLLLEGGEDSPLWLLARFAVISPLLVGSELPGGVALQAIYLLLYALPVVLWHPEGQPRRGGMLLLLVVPVFVSFRLAISIYSVCYCLIFLVDRRANPLTFIWFSIPVFLSSSTMFVYLLYFPLLAARRLRQEGLLVKALAWGLFGLVAGQFITKMFALFTRSLGGEVLSTAGTVGLDYSGTSGGFFLDMLSGNPFFLALVVGQYDRLVLLTASVLVAIHLLTKLASRGDPRVLRFVLILMASMLSEGVGAYSVGVVLFIILVHRRSFLNQRRRLRRPARVDDASAAAGHGANSSVPA